MTFHGKFPVKTKIVIDNYILEEISHFNYLEMDITYEKKGDINKKASKF